MKGVVPPDVNAAVARLAQLDPGPGVLQTSCEDGVWEVVLDSPRRASAVGPGMMVAFVELARRVVEEAPAAVILHSSSDRAFCAGGDLSAVRAHLLDAERADEMVTAMTWALDTLCSGPALVIAAVEGAALGGGAELLTACDRVVAGGDARVGFVHARLGVSPGWGGARRLFHRVGRRHATAWLVLAMPRTAEEARELGMVDRLVAPGHALDAARAEAKQAAELPGAARMAALQLGRGVFEDAERDAFLDLWGGPEHLAQLARVSKGRS